MRTQLCKAIKCMKGQIKISMLFRGTTSVVNQYLTQSQKHSRYLVTLQLSSLGSTMLGLYVDNSQVMGCGVCVYMWCGIFAYPEIGFRGHIYVYIDCLHTDVNNQRVLTPTVVCLLLCGVHHALDMLVQGEGHFSRVAWYSSGCRNTVETCVVVLGVLLEGRVTEVQWLDTPMETDSQPVRLFCELRRF